MFLREKVGLDGIRKQLLETALNGRETYDDVEREVLRLFKDLHAADPPQRRSFSQAEGKPGLMQRFFDRFIFFIRQTFNHGFFFYWLLIALSVQVYCIFSVFALLSEI